MANSPEYQTIVKLTPELTNAFKNDLVNLSDEFFAEGLISNDNAANLKNPHNGANHRASSLMAWIRNRIQQDPENNYLAFIKVLKRRLADHKSILKCLDEKYKELGGNVETGIAAALASFNTRKPSELNSASSDGGSNGVDTIRQRKDTRATHTTSENDPERIETDAPLEESLNAAHPPPSKVGPGDSKLTMPAILVLLAVVGGVILGAYTFSTSYSDSRNGVGEVLTGNDIRKVNDLIQAVKDVGDWKGLCRNLDVDEGTMDVLIKNPNSPPNELKAECLTVYFNSGKATWSKVVEAVANFPIKNKRLARKIANDHGIPFNDKNEL